MPKITDKLTISQLRKLRNLFRRYTHGSKAQFAKDHDISRVTLYHILATGKAKKITLDKIREALK